MYSKVCNKTSKRNLSFSLLVHAFHAVQAKDMCVQGRYSDVDRQATSRWRCNPIHRAGSGTPRALMSCEGRSRSYNHVPTVWTISLHTSVGICTLQRQRERSDESMTSEGCVRSMSSIHESHVWTRRSPGDEWTLV